MESDNYGRDVTCPAEEDNHLEKQADAVSGEPPCIDSMPGAADGAGQEEERGLVGPGSADDEITELEWARKYVHSGMPGSQGHKVFRKTELHDRPSSPYRIGKAGKKRRSARHSGEPEFLVPEEMQEFAKSIARHLNAALEDLYHEVTLVNEHVSKTDKKFRKLIRDLEWRVVDLEERGRSM